MTGVSLPLTAAGLDELRRYRDAGDYRRPVGSQSAAKLWRDGYLDREVRQVYSASRRGWRVPFYRINEAGRLALAEADRAAAARRPAIRSRATAEVAP